MRMFHKRFWPLDRHGIESTSTLRRAGAGLSFRLFSRHCKATDGFPAR